MSYLFPTGTSGIFFSDAAAQDVVSEYTISFWVKLLGAGVNMVPLRKLNNYAAYLAHEDGSRIFNALTKAGSAGCYRCKSTTDVTFVSFIGSWNNVVMRGASDGPLSVWINGIDRTQGVDYWFGDTRNLGEPLVIGNQASLDAYTNGYVAEVAIWNSLSIADARVVDLAAGLSPVDLSTPPGWYARLKANSNEHYSSATGSVSGATLEADHPPVVDPAGGGGGPTPPRNKVTALI